MVDIVKLPLEKENGKFIYYNRNRLYNNIKNLDCFVMNHSDMNQIQFAKKMMMSNEIQSNNNIEGIRDDLETIYQVIHKIYGSVSIEERTRIINLYYGYQFILKNHSIDKYSLRKLYSILSHDLLDEYSIQHMGKFYRKGNVYIAHSSSVEYDSGMSYQRLNYDMNRLFQYIHNNSHQKSIYQFLKSQIIHFYFVYLHPYFDVNGRTGRTLSLWYLLENDGYIYSSFNRAISYYKSYYVDSIMRSRKSGNLTYFLQYMLVVVLRELEQESLICDISSNSGIKLSSLEEQIIEYILMIKGEVTLKKLMNVYYHYNSRCDFQSIYYDRIIPLVEKKIILMDKNSNGEKIFYINKKNIGIDVNDFKCLKLCKG